MFCLLGFVDLLRFCWFSFIVVLLPRVRRLRSYMVSFCVCFYDQVSEQGVLFLKLTGGSMPFLPDFLPGSICSVQLDTVSVEK